MDLLNTLTYYNYGLQYTLNIGCSTCNSMHVFAERLYYSLIHTCAFTLIRPQQKFKRHFMHVMYMSCMALYIPMAKSIFLLTL